MQQKSPVRRQGFNPPEADKYQETVKPAAPDRKASEHTSRVNSEKKPFTEVKGF